MEVFALFGDGSISAVSCELYGSDDFAGRVFVDNKDVRDSGHKGIWAAHLAIQTKNYFYTAEFKEDNANYGAQGKSAGLAFALKFAFENQQQTSQSHRHNSIEATGDASGHDDHAKVLSFGYINTKIATALQLLRAREVIVNPKDNAPQVDDTVETSQPRLCNSIAATGEVSGHGGRAKVCRVGHINAKIAAALGSLKGGDLIVYPKDNDPEIDNGLRQRAVQCEIELIPVGTVKEALIAVGILIRENWLSRMLHWLSRTLMKYGLASAMILSAIGILFLWSKTDQVITPLDLVQYGRFSEARNAAILAMKDSTSAASVAESAPLLRRLQTPLSIRIAFEYDKANDTGIKQNKHNDVVLSKGDGYRFDITPSLDCFFYAFQFDSNNEVELLFPLAGFSMENHLLHGSTLYGIPASDSYFFLEDSTHQGQLTLYLLASSWRAKDIEEKYQQYENASVELRRTLSDELLARIYARDKALKQGFKGLFFNKAAFLQVRK